MKKKKIYLKEKIKDRGKKGKKKEGKGEEGKKKQ